MKKIFALMAALVCMSLGLKAAEGDRIVNDICYTAKKDAYSLERCKLDVYTPQGAQNAPVLLWYHGGGLTGGSKFLPEHLKNNGIVVIAVNYRLMPKVGIDGCIDDTAESVAWAFRHCAEYGGDPAKIFVCGHSAGGYLTSMVGLDKKWLAAYGIDANDIKGLIPFSGQAITHFAHRNLQGIGPLQATIDEYAPLTYVRGDAAPILIISGDRELEMNGRYEEQAYFWRMLCLTGHKDARILELQGYGHGPMCNPAFPLAVNFVREHVR